MSLTNKAPADYAMPELSPEPTLQQTIRTGTSSTGNPDDDVPKIPWFPPPLPGCRVGNKRISIEVRQPLWELFWKLPIKEQVEAFKERPNSRELVGFSGEEVCCIRHPLNQAPVLTRIRFEVPLGFPKFTEGDPYLTLDEWFNFDPQKLHDIENKRFEIFDVIVGPGSKEKYAFDCQEIYFFP